MASIIPSGISPPASFVTMVSAYWLGMVTNSSLISGFAASKSCGIFCNTPDDAERFHKMGANVYWTGADVQFLQMGIDETFTRLAQIG